MRRLNDVTGPARALRFRTGGIRRVAHRTGTAMEVIGPLAPGDRVTGVTGGQFSVIDALEHMLDELGPADVALTAWTTGIYDARRARDLGENGAIKSIRIMLDSATFMKSPQYAGQLVDQLGVETFRAAAIHSKIVIVSGERGRAVLRTSAGFNKNVRTEQFDIDVSDEVEAFYREWFDALWEASGKQLNNEEIFREVFDRFVAMGRPEAIGRWRFVNQDAEVVEAKARAVQRTASRRSGASMRLQDVSMTEDELRDLLGE